MNFTSPDFQAKNFTPSISPNFNSFSKKKRKKIVKMEKFTPLARNFTLLPGLTGWTNSTSESQTLVVQLGPNCFKTPSTLVESPAQAPRRSVNKLFRDFYQNLFFIRRSSSNNLWSSQCLPSDVE